MTRGDELYKNIKKYFESLRYQKDLWTVYSDFLELIAISISNACEHITYPERFEKREKRYLDIAKNYSKDELLLFSKVFQRLAEYQDYNISTSGAKDILGALLMELELADKWGGQFFTPMDVANLMAKLFYPSEWIKNEIATKGFIIANDSAVGGGATMIGLVNAMLECGFNPQKQLFVECNDLDGRACLMAYIQLATLGVPAIVRKQNTLTNQIYDTWITPAFYIDGWIGKLKGFKDKEKGESIAKSKENIAKREEILDKKTERPQEEEEIIDEEDEQLSLF